ncbi:hypothetical protein V1264_022994 [Littorina saxatilis]|uniref:Uncharacterized protein n=1 Tax=Littorina saxatilis TaxID=31220 RepID=A0AAN9G988_9CAEN
MRLTNQVLRSRSERPLSTVEYLDLSNLGIVSLGERLSSCTNLETLILSGNKLQDAIGVDVCGKQLWHLDLSNNWLQSVDGLSRFLALGTLVLSNNDLDWPVLANLTHLHILSLSLHGNQKLERDPYYRIHVIDCLPNVWMLDGRIVTSAERIQVDQFFKDSALKERPVRHKLRKKFFVTSTLQTIERHAVCGRKAIQMLKSYPKNGVCNIEMDWNRLHYLAKDFQDDINLMWKYIRRKSRGQFVPKKTLLVDLFEVRQNHGERCNMVLLLLMASLEFLFPTHLLKDTLETGKLLTIGNVQTMDLFLLPRTLRCKVVSLLFCAVKVDREQNEDGGLYMKLYLCLFHMMSELTKLSESTAGVDQSDQDSKLAAQLQDYKCLLATEVAQLMCIVPSFFDYLDRDVGVMNLMRVATADPDINEKLTEICGTKSEEGEDEEEVSGRKGYRVKEKKNEVLRFSSF